MIKLFRRFTKLKRVIYFGLVVILIDFISMITYPRIFYNFFNMLSVMLYSTSLIYCLIRFSSQIQTVDIHLYKMIQRVNHLLYVTVAVLYMDLIYIVVAKVILDFDFLLNSISSSPNNLFLSISFFIIYFLINTIAPIFIIRKISIVKDTIIRISKSGGIDVLYSKTQTEIQTDEIASSRNK